MKQRDLERKGINCVALLPPYLTVQLCGTQSQAEVTSPRHSRVPEDAKSRKGWIRPAPDDLESQGHAPRVFPSVIIEDLKPNRNDSHFNVNVEQPRAINSAVTGIGMQLSKRGESVVTSLGKSKTTLGYFVLTHNYSSTVQAEGGTEIQCSENKRGSSCRMTSQPKDVESRMTSLGKSQTSLEMSFLGQDDSTSEQTKDWISENKSGSGCGVLDDSRFLSLVSSLVADAEDRSG